jgi:hypothetical protein
MLEHGVQWCAVCNSRPADGILTIILNDQEEDIPACAPCVYDKEKVEFI